MAITATGLSMQAGQRITERLFSLAMSGNYTTGGDTLDLTAALSGGVDGIKNFTFAGIKLAYDIGSPSGQYFEVIPGTTLKNYKIKWYQASGSEVANGAYPGTLTTLASPAVVGIISTTGK